MPRRGADAAYDAACDRVKAVEGELAEYLKSVRAKMGCREVCLTCSLPICALCACRRQCPEGQLVEHIVDRPRAERSSLLAPRDPVSHVTRPRNPLTSPACVTR